MCDLRTLRPVERLVHLLSVTHSSTLLLDQYFTRSLLDFLCTTGTHWYLLTSTYYSCITYVLTYKSMYCLVYSMYIVYKFY